MTSTAPVRTASSPAKFQSYPPPAATSTSTTPSHLHVTPTTTPSSTSTAPSTSTSTSESPIITLNQLESGFTHSGACIQVSIRRAWMDSSSSTITTTTPAFTSALSMADDIRDFESDEDKEMITLHDEDADALLDAIDADAQPVTGKRKERDEEKSSTKKSKTSTTTSHPIPPSSTTPSVHHYEMIDRHPTAHAPIEVDMHGIWATCDFKKDDRLTLHGGRVVDSGSTDPLDCQYKLIYDESADCQNASITYETWQDRVVGRPGTVYTIASLRAGTVKLPQTTTITTTDVPATQGHKKKPGEKYEYIPLADLRVKQVCNFYGVVTQFTLPKKTKGADSMVSLVIRDKSLSDRDDGIVVNIFRRQSDALPLVKNKGDIIRIHRAEITSYLGKLTGVMYEKKSAFVVVDGTIGGSMIPYAPVGAGYSELHEDVIIALRQWYPQMAAAAGPSLTADSQKYIKKLCELTRRSTTPTHMIDTWFCDLIVQALHVDNHDNVHVWDGTDLPSNDQVTLLRNGVLTETGFPTPAHGSILAVSLPPYRIGPLASIQPGQWLHLRNLNISIDNKGCVYAKYHDNSKYSPLALASPQVQQAITAYQARLTSIRDSATRAALNPTLSPTSLTSMIHEYAPITPIHMIQQQAYVQGVCMKYRLRVRVVGHFPEKIEEFTQIYCNACQLYSDCSPSSAVDQCSQCKASNTISYQYLVQFIVRDATGILPIILAGDDAASFFHGISADNLHKSQATFKQTQQLVTSMLAPGAWMDCCILGEPSNPLPSTSTRTRVPVHTTTVVAHQSYRLCDTTLK